MSKVVVITGASSGIGAATAYRFAKDEGIHLVLLARRKDRLEKMQKELKTKVSIYELDITQKDKVEKTIQDIEKTIGPIDILVNNAGAAFGLEPAYECKIEDWEKCVDVNIKGLLYCTRFVLPYMVKRDKGHIINLGSVAGTYPYPGGNVYGATKAFVHQFSLNLRADLLGKNIRVTCIEPGLVETEFSLVRFRGDEKRAKSVYENTKALTADDIAETIYISTTLPQHVNINTLEVMPVMQAASGFSISKSR